MVNKCTDKIITFNVLHFKTVVRMYVLLTVHTSTGVVAAIKCRRFVIEEYD